MAIVLLYILLDVAKSATVGGGFSIIKAILHGSDYTNWYKHSYTYIPRKKREQFKKQRAKQMGRNIKKKLD